MTPSLRTSRPSALIGLLQTSLADVVALISGAVIVLSYLILPLRADGIATGFAFIDQGTTFPILTVVVGLVAIVSALVNIFGLRERDVRWWFVGLGLMGFIFLLDNTLRGKAGFAIGGWIAMLGNVGLLVQAALPRPGYKTENRGNDTILGLIRVFVATLWLSQLLWKLPWNNFGCAAGPLIPAASTSGLCDWIGKEIASPRWPIYKDFLTGLVTPNLGWLAFFIVAGEAFACFSLMFGFLTRLGGLAGLLMGINLFVGLTAVRGEWDWTYLMLPLINAVFMVVGGRFVGIDALLYAWADKRAATGSRLWSLLARVL